MGNVVTCQAETEHLPECWAKLPSDPIAWCICDELRACEQRVRSAAREAVNALPALPGTSPTFSRQKERQSIYAEGRADFKYAALATINEVNH